MSAFTKQCKSVLVKLDTIEKRTKLLTATLKTWHMALPHMAGNLEKSIQDLDDLALEINDIFNIKGGML